MAATNYHIALELAHMLPCATDSEDILTMAMGSWLGFCNDATIINPSQRGCLREDLQVLLVPGLL